MRSKMDMRSLLAVGLVWFSTATASLGVASSGLEYAVIDIDAIGFEGLLELRRTEGIAWWVELDDELLVLAEDAALDRLALHRELSRSELGPAPDRLLFLGAVDPHDTPGLYVDVLARGGRFMVVQTRGGRSPMSLDPHRVTMPFRPNTVLARQWANYRPQQARADRVEASIQNLVDEVDSQRWFNDVTALAGYNRHTHGSEILDARDWLVLQFEALPGLSVTTESFQVGGTTAFNVVAELTGSQRPDDWYIVGAHYDATSENPGTAAPGAEDNASGCAGVVEMARILTNHPPDATIIFICYSGEEQGLFGSVDHASQLISDGSDDQLQMMLNMDMIGFTEDNDLDCLLETAPAFADLTETFAAAADLYTTLRIVVSLYPFGSDHVPYISRGMPALLTIENDWSSYPHYHSTTDLPGGLSMEMGGEIVRMNVAALAMMIGATAPETIFADGFESGDRSAWSSSTP